MEPNNGPMTNLGNPPVLNRRPSLGYSGHNGGHNGRTGQHNTITQQPVSAPEQNQSVSEPNKSARLIVGPNIKLKGVEISDCEALVVEGVVEATLRAQHVHIVENGLLSGKVVAEIAEIHGEFRGDLTVRDRLVIHATGRVTGTIRYNKIKIEEGASLSGNIAPVNEGETMELPLESAA